MPKAEELQKAAEQIIEEAKLTKGNQQLSIAKAYVDPTSFCSFMVREDILLHLKIDPIPDGLQDTDKAFFPRKKAAATTKKINTASSLGAGLSSRKTKTIVGRAIKIPTGGGLTRKGKPIKFVKIRVPAFMSHAAICLWINTCFKQANKKPAYFISESGGRIDIYPTFVNKANLPNKKNE